MTETRLHYANVTHYHVLIHGSIDGYHNSRAQISLFDRSKVIGYIRFHDSGMQFPKDELTDEKLIIMHLPTLIFDNVLNIFRNEKPLEYYFGAGRAALETSEMSREPVGEGE